MKKVMILGCGPSGLLAAHAADMLGYEPVIISKKRTSEMYGAQYLHAYIPGTVDSNPFDVKYVLEGSVDDYRKKVYGKGHRGNVSPEDLSQDHKGWDIRQMNELLYARYEGAIEDTVFANEREVGAYIQTADMYGDFHSFISTLPSTLLCQDASHIFSSQKVWAMGDAPERGVFVPIPPAPLNTVICSGLSDDSWYRKSNILGYCTVEWPEAKKPPITGVASVIKPLKTTCTCLPHVHRMGRYGKWQKGVLSHEAFFETYAGLGGDLEEIRPKESRMV